MFWLTRCAPLVCGLLTSACLSGAVYTHVTEPLDVNFDRTPVYQTSVRGSLNQLQYRNLQINWGGTGLGQLAKDHGFKRIDYADLETLSILGLYTRTTVHIYGER